ncbi:MAG: Bax inhibitor-1/YccA family protein [Sulfuriferula sp.]|nr:Bax inhibitor-1/YccA family protein [Sulfuriferula sp.]
MQPEIHLSSTGSLAEVQNKVLRNTYMMLALTMIPTIIGAYMGMSINFSFMAQHPILSMLGMLAVMFGVFMGIAANRNNALGVVLLLAATGLFGLMLGPVLQAALHFSNGAQLIAMAAGGTGAIFFTLATIATVTKKDFSFMGKFLFVGLIMLVLASLANAFFHIPVASLAISAIAIMLFSGYILYDISQIIHGGETNYVMATLAIYLDIYNIFVNLLNLLMALAGNRD